METASRIIPITDDRGKVLVPGDEYEPEPGSVVLTEGQFGTAWQRFFDDGLWYRAGGRVPVDWAYLVQRRNLVLVYDAPERES